jgi:hypothetical protein
MADQLSESIMQESD